MSRIVYDSSRYYEAKAKLPRADGVHCRICGIEFDKPDKRKSYCSQKCFSKWYSSLKVDDWSRIREEVLERDGRCIKCGLKIGARREHYIVRNDKIVDVHIQFEVHHIKPICEGGKEFDPDNCITLCYDCHKELHSIVGKKIRRNRSLNEFVSVHI